MIAPNATSVLFAGERPVRSAPSLTLARALEEHGIRSRFSGDLEWTSTREWLQLARESSVLIVVRDDPGSFFLRQVCLAVAHGTPAIRWWVGTDVSLALENARTRQSGRSLQRVLSRQIAVSPHLVEELATMKLRAEFIPSVLDPGLPPRILDHVPKSLLVYLPGSRRDFYGESTIRRAIEAYPDIEFVVVGDQTHSLSCYANVRDLGWVSDMEPAWNRVGGLLRVTRHDGMPRMVLDALRRGKHVLYSWPFPGCQLTRTDDEVLDGIAKFRETGCINLRGMSEVKRIMDPAPAEQFAHVIRESAVGGHILRRVSAARCAATQTLLMKRKVRSGGLVEPAPLPKRPNSQGTLHRR